MEIFRIITLPDPRLRHKSRDLSVDEVTKPEFQVYLDKLIKTMDEANGVGIASPQVGENIRAAVVSLSSGVECIINPETVKASEAKIQTEEGCLSVPGRYGIVERSKKITVRALNRHGRRIEIEAKNLDAVILQHEIDHLNGILFIDRMSEATERTSRHI